MESRRQQKVASLLKDSMATYFMKKRGDFLGNRVLSVFFRQRDAGHGVLRFYVSFLPDKEKQAMVDAHQTRCVRIRADIAKDLRLALRVIPVIEFYLDDSIAHASHMEEFSKTREEVVEIDSLVCKALFIG